MLKNPTTGLATLNTPSLVLDKAVLAANTERMTSHLKDRGIRFRPHMKTAKSIDVTRIAIAGNFGGVMVSTLREAEYLADHGISDITYGVSVLPDKLQRIAALVRRGVKVGVILDRCAVAEQISREAVRFDITLDVLIELDSGERRAGVTADSADLIELGHALERLPGTHLQGVLTHAGQSYQCRTVADIERVAEEERLSVVTAAERLRAAGLRVDVVSAGSTPTATHGKNFDGLTEIRCGVYMFGDMMQSQIYSCSRDDIALSVLATVTGHRPALNTALIDAGALALSKDRSTEAPGLTEDIGFGLVMDMHCQHRIADVKVGHVYQEHGMLVSSGPFPFEALPVGSRIRVLPNHACMTAAMHDGYNVVNGTDDTGIEFWPRVNGW
ncbi:D-serine deaminase-like pyridoxal phosphate-dependent protein [Rhizobium sp. BK068]|nr:D-serine deaminase-like pyridoxal phosphate-dependent protein [Rhizobium sp. BK068]